MSRLFITPRHLQTVERHASIIYPEECCGVLIGRCHSGATFVERVLSVGNEKEGDRHDRYLISPETVLAAHKEARALGLEVVGYYHSHPDHPARPSETDREQAWPGVSYLIVSVEKRKVVDTRSWRLSEDGSTFEEEVIDRAAIGSPPPAGIPGSTKRLFDLTTSILPELTPAETRHYSRHLVMPEVGSAGQRRLKAARVLVIGAGGLGSPLGLYLAAAGVGTLGLVDFDVVDETNLHRQVLYGRSSVGRPKIQAAVERLRDINPHIRIVPHEMRLDIGNALELFQDYDIIVDGTDNFPTRYLVNDACVLAGKPNVYGSIFRFEGQVSIFWGARGPCYRCLFPEPPPAGLVPSCAEGGVLGVLPGIIGSLQANEVIKLIVGVGEPLIGRLVLFDALKMRFRELQLKKDPACPICSAQPTQRGLVDYEQLCGPGAGVETAAMDFEMTVSDLKERLDAGDSLTLLDVRTDPELEIARIEGAIHIPLHELQDRVEELDPQTHYVVVCHHGGRSAHAVGFLRQVGFERAVNLAGGIDEWSAEIDPGIPRY